ncbi:hypothetical protein E4K72_18125 [Oxalobacteraceae bacterium OM1]|nr:hypothetical protein E4K72_18125 [Oxalobacteraceae bacterium OM1]
MRILFLEFDGVLHPASAAARFTMARPLKRSIQDAWLFRWAWILDELLESHPDVGIVTHSNWRYLAPDDELQSFLGPVARRFVGSAPRGERWVSIARVVRESELREYRILDPLPGAFPNGTEELIVCDPEAGLKELRVQGELKEWLQASALHAGGGVPRLR